jgi:hypothetical protein
MGSMFELFLGMEVVGGALRMRRHPKSNLLILSLR